MRQPTRHIHTELHEAAMMGRADKVRALIEAGIDVDAMNGENETALHTAATFGQLEIVELLLDAGADPTVVNNYGYMASDCAAMADHREIIDAISESALGWDERQAQARQAAERDRLDTVRRRIMKLNRGPGR